MKIGIKFLILILLGWCLAFCFPSQSVRAEWGDIDVCSYCDGDVCEKYSLSSNYDCPYECETDDDCPVAARPRLVGSFSGSVTTGLYKCFTVYSSEDRGTQLDFVQATVTNPNSGYTSSKLLVPGYTARDMCVPVESTIHTPECRSPSDEDCDGEYYTYSLSKEGFESASGRFYVHPPRCDTPPLGPTSVPSDDREPNSSACYDGKCVTWWALVPEGPGLCQTDDDCRLDRLLTASVPSAVQPGASVRICPVDAENSSPVSGVEVKIWNQYSTAPGRILTNYRRSAVTSAGEPCVSLSVKSTVAGHDCRDGGWSLTCQGEVYGYSLTKAGYVSKRGTFYVGSGSGGSSSGSGGSSTPTSGGSGGSYPTSTPDPSCPLFSRGDANCDSQIDDLDYVMWWQSYQGDTTADFNADGTTDDLDYVIWWQNYGGG